MVVGDVLAVAAWIWAYDKLQTYDKRLALILLIVIFVGAMVGSFCARVRRTRKRKRAQEEPSPTEAEDALDAPQPSLSGAIAPEAHVKHENDPGEPQRPGP